MFLDIDKKDRNSYVAIDDFGRRLTYGELCGFVKQYEGLGLSRAVVFCFCDNSIGAFAGYMAIMSTRQVPLMLSANMNSTLVDNLINEYEPMYCWMPKQMAKETNILFSAFGFVLVKNDFKAYDLNPELSILLTTSGSTGSPKLVRHKYGNLEANAQNVAMAFGWTKREKGICDLPMNYTMGLNVINSHVVVGATVLLAHKNLMDPTFWEFVKNEKGTNFTGVPFSYDVLRRLNLTRESFPELTTFAEGGGKLSEKMFRWATNFCEENGNRFVATFGTTETSARMSLLDSNLASRKTCSIGRAIPEGTLFLIDEKKLENGRTEGELCYKGPNVTMGYATKKEDLQKGDIFRGVYHTGDIAQRDEEGYYYIVGRKGRFLKLYGLRVSLDETERIIGDYLKCEVACVGDDKRMEIFVTKCEDAEAIINYISKITGIVRTAFNVQAIDEIPRNSAGKILYSELKIN